MGRSISFSREVCGSKAPHIAEGESRDIWTGCWSSARRLNRAHLAESSAPQ
jgi:hypothetical protein